MKVVDSAGRFVGPVAEFSDMSARIFLDVQGYAVGLRLEIHSIPNNPTEYEYYFTGQASVIYFESNDCTGTAFLQMGSSAPHMSPVTAVGRQAGKQVVYVADERAPLQTVMVRSVLSNSAIPACVVRNPPQGDVLGEMVPVVATLDLTTLGTPPFRVVPQGR